MRKIKLFLIAMLLSSVASAQPSLRWNYPCKPGTECWNALTSVEERQEACQIKGIDLKTLSTEELLLITMEHPFFWSYVFHDSAIDGISFAISEFNGFQEFVNRKDALKTLLEVYAREDITRVIQIEDSIQIGEYTLKWTGFELVMTFPTLWSGISREECQQYVRLIHEKLVSKRSLVGFFGATSFRATALTYYHLTNHFGRQLPPALLEQEGFDLFKTKLIVTNSSIEDLLLADLDLLMQGK